MLHEEFVLYYIKSCLGFIKYFITPNYNMATPAYTNL